MANEPIEQREWDDPLLTVASDSRRTARHRLHQSWYRQHVLRAAHGEVGSMLAKSEVATRPGLNFVDEAAFAHAQRRAVEVQAEGGTLEAGRLRHNMLSSMPMCFNVFGSLHAQPAFIEVFRQMFDPTAVTIESVVCEHRPATTVLQDRTAFDAAVTYLDDAGRRVLCGIETKYTEPFSAKEYSGGSYRQLTEQCGWFVDGAADALVRTGTNQLWRNLLLAADAELHRADAVDRAWVAVVALADDPHVAGAVAGVDGWLNDTSRCRAVSLESVVEAAGGVGLQRWARTFGERYLPGPDRG